MNERDRDSSIREHDASEALMHLPESSTPLVASTRTAVVNVRKSSTRRTVSGHWLDGMWTSGLPEWNSRGDASGLEMHQAEASN